jgi:N6-adenosine-specific RNA methylase IME4
MTISANGSMRSLKRRKYGAIYADPPWSFRNWSAKGTGRNAVSHYDCLSFERLATLPMRDLAAENCVLFLWAVDPLLDKAFELMRAWGFEYKTVGFYWVKQNARLISSASCGKARLISAAILIAGTILSMSVHDMALTTIQVVRKIFSGWIRPAACCPPG